MSIDPRVRLFSAVCCLCLAWLQASAQYVSPYWRVFEGAANERIGLWVAAAGDVNGDGAPDLVFGGDHWMGDGKGIAYICFGGDSTDAVPDVILPGFGWSVAGVGDVNGDGYDDVAVGQPMLGSTTEPGNIYLYYGGNPMDSIPDVIMSGTEPGQAMGFGFSGPVDLNKDGYMDVVACGITSNSVHIHFGGPSPNPLPDLQLLGAVSASSAGDLNKDGFGDIIVGGCLLYFGGSPMDTIPDLTLVPEVPPATVEAFGRSVAGGIDINGDSWPDFIVGAPKNNAGGTEAGRVYVYFGGAVLDSIPDFVITGSGTSNHLGWNVAALGDLDKDGYDDFSVSSDVDLLPISGRKGKVQIYRGGPTITLSATHEGEDVLDNFGWSVAAVGDFDQGGSIDIAIGAQFAPSNTKRGKVYLSHDKSRVTVIDNVVYTPPGYVDGEYLATLFVPDPLVARKKAIVVGHGLGDSRLGRPKPWCDSLSANGYLVMTIDFPEIGPNGLYPKPVRAFKTAVEFLRRNPEQYGLDPDHPIVYGLGKSQGSVIWAQSITWDDDDAFFGTDPAVPDYIDKAVLLYGAYDALHNLIPQFEYLTTQYFSADPSLRATKGNPIVNTKNIKTRLLLIHGTEDQSISIRHSWALRDSLAATVPCSLITYGEDHSFDVTYPDSFNTWGYDAFRQVLSWFDDGPISAVEEQRLELPQDYSLDQNYPNPFNPSTTISFTIKDRSDVTLKIYDLLGREVATLIDDKLAAGKHSIEFHSKGLASGVYVYRLHTSSFVSARRMILLK